MENPYRTPAAELEMTAAASDIDTLDVSERWKERFRLLDMAGPMVGGKLQNIERIGRRERTRIAYNWLAFLFSPIYYFVKGMPRKGLVLLGLGWLWIALVTSAEGVFGFRAPNTLFWIPSSIVAAALANWDYYMKVVHGKSMWQPVAFMNNWAACLGFVLGSFAVLALSVVKFA